MLKPRTLLFLLLFILAFTWLFSAGLNKLGKPGHAKAATTRIKAEKKLSEKLRTKAEEARTFARTKNFNERICFLVDMSLPSG